MTPTGFTQLPYPPDDDSFFERHPWIVPSFKFLGSFLSGAAAYIAIVGDMERLQRAVPFLKAAAIVIGLSFVVAAIIGLQHRNTALRRKLDAKELIEELLKSQFSLSTRAKIDELIKVVEPMIPAYKDFCRYFLKQELKKIAPKYFSDDPDSNA